MLAAPWVLQQLYTQCVCPIISEGGQNRVNLITIPGTPGAQCGLRRGNGILMETHAYASSAVAAVYVVLTSAEAPRPVSRSLW